MLIIVSQMSSMYFYLSRVIKQAQIAALISYVFLMVLSFQSHYIADIITLSSLEILIVIINVSLLMRDIAKKGVLTL